MRRDHRGSLRIHARNERGNRTGDCWNKTRSRVEVRRHSLLRVIDVSIQAVRSSMSLSINFVVANIAAVVQLIPLCQGLKRLVRIIWVYIGIIVRNDGALRSKGEEEAIYISVCGLCAARDTLTSRQYGSKPPRFQQRYRSLASKYRIVRHILLRVNRRIVSRMAPFFTMVAEICLPKNLGSRKCRSPSWLATSCPPWAKVVGAG